MPKPHTKIIFIFVIPNLRSKPKHPIARYGNRTVSDSHAHFKIYYASCIAVFYRKWRKIARNFKALGWFVHRSIITVTNNMSNSSHLIVSLIIFLISSLPLAPVQCITFILSGVVPSKTSNLNTLNALGRSFIYLILLRACPTIP